MKSKTPRTDKAAFSYDTFNGVDPWEGERYIKAVPAKLAAELERENTSLREALMPFAQIGDIANDHDSTAWKRVVVASDVRRARELILSNIESIHPESKP
jgi:hypothetical protein